ncbi:MAG: DUF2304 domain-containing protein [Bacilli bacterium]|nr:DUF2304 domain-containing protein [Bacilli bacterium]MDD4298277.1 DUF2304 domain-containing protein [Bacilli bacterium]MDD4643952.1 DUF2304 domain-containing protein [Bacilli bacterium]
MTLKLTIELIICNILFMVFVYTTVRKKKILLKYALPWFAASTLLIVFSLTPNLMKKIANFVDIETVSNMIFLFVVGMNLIITFSLTATVSNQNTKIATLVKEIGILKEKVNRDKKD